jgi:hypothetical protein
VVPEAEVNEHPAVAALAGPAGCEELETQAHIAAVESQFTCRRGTERLYLMTFRTAADRDTYLEQGPQVVPGGFNVVGPTWVVHVETAAIAETLADQLQGAVRAGP